VIAHQRAFRKSNQFPMRVAVVDGQDEAAGEMSRDPLQPFEPALLEFTHPNALTRGATRLDRIVPDESVLLHRNAPLEPTIVPSDNEIHRQRVKELVAEEDSDDRLRQRAEVDINRRIAKVHHCLIHLPATGSEFDDLEFGRISHFVRELSECGCDQPTEHRLQLLSRVEISFFAEGVSAVAVVLPKLGMIERQVHEPAERHGSSLLNLSGDDFANGTRLCHRPYCMMMPE
jgi:hypothetical protein